MAAKLYDILQISPFLSAAVARKRTKLTAPTVNAALEQLQLGIAIAFGFPAPSTQDVRRQIRGCCEVRNLIGAAFGCLV